jgi:alkanesulfonate monooxygenase SsuD/methylene tetrahydromethanopterin reductase-like flavin-dependent oxidoreductase (luciferase family)
VLEKLWTGKPTSHEGSFYKFPLVTHPPAPVSPIPLIGCGLSEGMMKRTARRMDGWFGPAVALDVSMRAVAELDRLRQELRRGGPFSSYVRLEGAFDEANLEKHHAAGVEHLVVSMALLGIPPNAGLEERVSAIERAGERLTRFHGEPQRLK